MQNIDWLNTVELLKNCVHVKKFKVYSNFIVFRRDYVYTLFKPGIGKSSAHLNITKLRDKSEILKAVNIIKNKISGQLLLSTIKIDNITCSLHLNREINLREFYKTNNSNLQISYKSEKFPGLFVKTNKGTILIFHTGRVILVGCKTKRDIKWLMKLICAYIPSQS